MKKISFCLLAIIAICACSKGPSIPEVSLDELQEGFQNPPQEARVQVWWHWMNGNITKDGIKKDLTWMKRIGLGGFHHFDAGVSTPQIVENRLVYMDEGWKDAFAYATALADSLGLEMTVASAPGWSATGGPWVEPKDGMKKLVWKSVNVMGGKNVSLSLPEPYKTTGLFQNIPLQGNLIEAEGKPAEEYYEDIAVLAMKVPEEDLSMQEMGAKLSSSSGKFSLEQLTDGDLTNSSMLMAQPSGYAWIQYEFPTEQLIKSVIVYAKGNGMMLQSSKDGKNFTDLCPIVSSAVGQVTLNIPETKAKYFRLKVDNPKETPGLYGILPPTPPAPGTDVAEFLLSGVTLVNHAEDKAGYTIAKNMNECPTVSSNENFTHLIDVIDLTANVIDGKLTWNAPEGKWRIYRFGFSLTGKKNHPAPPEATGLEVDKMDPVAFSNYMHHYLDMYKDASKGLIGDKGIRYILTDSYEAEQETWTPAMFEEFKRLRGYDLKPWLPVLTGAIIDSAERSERFLHDWRQTLGDLVVSTYNLVSQIAINDYGMKGRYTESHENDRVLMSDGMDMKRTAEIPMSAMWVNAPWLPFTSFDLHDFNRTLYEMDDHESASVAHIFGQNIAAAESMTAVGLAGMAYGFYPGNLKLVADLELANGINRIVVHESAHQPVDDKIPGLSLMSTGQWFNRHETWAELAYAWVDYLSRSCYMLQQGKNVADVLVYYGEDNNVTSLYNGVKPEVADGYQYDFCSPNTFMDAISYKDGEYISGPSGTTYKLLWLDKNVEYMSVKYLRKLANLAKAGALIAGKRPKYPASLEDSQEEFNKLVKDIWDSGLKNVTSDISMEEVMKLYGIEPDFKSDVEGLKFLHRDLGLKQIYWINKPSDDAKNVTVTLRTTGLKPQIWHPETGLMEDVSYTINQSTTTVQVPMVENDAVFVVFIGKTKEDSFTVLNEEKKDFLLIDSPWTVKFQENRGAPDSIEMSELMDLTLHNNPGIKYFSGIASYTTSFNVSELSGSKQYVDLGRVGSLAEVWVNGENLGVVWKTPYMLEISDALRQGENILEIKVASLWKNRLIGDKQPGSEPITYTDMPYFSGSEDLAPAGLIGPVKILTN